MSTTTPLGKVSIVPKGAYAAGTTYAKLDVITYLGASYMALKAVTGVTPTNDGVNYQLLAEKGATGTTGTTGTAGTNATITSATATGLAAGATPTVTAGGTASARTFAFGIPIGATGAKGDAGTPGTPGTPGIKGDKGDKGDTGDTGLKGDKGDIGNTGVAGANAVWTQITQAAYDALSPPNAGTLYVIVG